MSNLEQRLKEAEAAAERNLDKVLKWHERAQDVAAKLAEYIER